MDDRLVQFIAALRATGVRVSLAESQDAARAAEVLGVRDRMSFKNALKATLIKEHGDGEAYERLFPLFFGSGGPPLIPPQQALTPEQQRALEDALRALAGDLSRLLQRMAPDHVTHNNNVVTSYNALRGAVDAGIKHVCQASSINAIGGAYSRQARYDYLPVDEQHPTYAEDPYSLSKWICEQQADSIARRYEDMTIGSLRFHWVVPDADLPRRLQAQIGRPVAMHLWGYTLFASAAEACLRVIGADYRGHEVFYIVERDTVNEETTAELVNEFWPNTPIRGDISGHRSLFDCSKAGRLLGWKSQPAH